MSSYLRRFYISFATNISDIPPRLLAFLVFLVMVCLPVTKPTEYVLGILVLANINALFATSWDLLVGRSGQISLGHAIFFGIGAYSAASLYKFFDFSPWLSLPLSIPLGFLVALLLGYLCLRVKGPYLALVSLAFPLILVRLLFLEIPGLVNFRALFGGEFGMLVPSFLSIPPYTPYQLRLFEYYFSLLMFGVCLVALYKIARSKTGIIFVSILDDELASKASGINTTKYKLMAFAISAFFASLAGGFYAHFNTNAGTSTLLFGSPTAPGSFVVIIMTIFGGIGTIYGPIVGAYVLTLLPVLIRQLIEMIGRSADIRLPIEELTALVYIVVVIAIVIKWREGIAKSVVEQLDDLAEVEEIRKDKKRGRKRR